MHKVFEKCSGIILIFLLMPFFSEVWAVPNSGKEHQEKIQEIIQQLQNNALLTGDFEQVRKLQGFTRSIKSTGNFIYWRDHGLYWETKWPFPHASTFMQNGVIDWQQSTGIGPEINSSNPILNKISSILISLIGGDIQTINRSFRADWTFSENNWSLKLDPVELMISRAITDIQIAGQQFVKNIVVTTAGNDITEITFLKIISKETPDQLQCSYFKSTDIDACVEPPKTARIIHPK